jgi:site-specific recombinase XerD
VLTRLIREYGQDLVSVARISGHKNIQTLSIYSQPSKEDMEKMMEKLAFTD